MKIKILEPHVSNQIAAGEVIERPASVVKELLENALDSGARHIQVELGFGGLNEIKVSDDGDGILAEDLPLAITPHATSKLTVLDDLYAIQSMGFRGEALASIASIAHVSIESKAQGATDATRLLSDDEGMRLLPCARNQGTTVLVRDLFFNAPVRKKFLKSEKQEYQAIEAMVKRIAFSAPDVALTLIHNEKQRLALPRALSVEDVRVRLRRLLGKTFIDEAVAIDITRGNMRLHGWVSGPNYARSQQDKLWFYINQRMVRDKLLLHALRQAYVDILPEGRYPGCVLFLELPYDEVDVNVHPTKHEVRFSDGRAVHDLIRAAIAEKFFTLSAPEVAHPVQTTDALMIEERAPEMSVQVGLQTGGSWTVLNSKFALLTHKGTPYLIDAERLYHKMRMSELKAMTVPWASRPLLLPMSIELTEKGILKLEAHRDLFTSFGWQFDILSKTKVSIAGMPQAVPGLDIPGFINWFVEAFSNATTDVIAALLEFELVNLMTMPEDEQVALIQYWQSECEALKGVSLCLDKAGCTRALQSA